MLRCPLPSIRVSQVMSRACNGWRRLFASAASKKSKPWVDPSVDFPYTDVPYVDSHTHLQSTFSALREQAAREGAIAPDYRSSSDFHRFALDQRLDRFAKFGAAINVNFQASTFASGLELQRGVASVYGTFGVHPHNASEYGDEVEARMLNAMADAKSVAVGEMGLDYHVMNSPRDVQLACFRRQLRWAVEVARKPVVLHTRDAEADTRLVLEEVLEHRPLWHIHLHCFTGSREFATWALERFPNLFIGFTGCVTFPSAASLCDVVRDVPLRRLLLETDAPYMAPAPFRGRVSHSGLIPLVARRVAEIKSVAVADVLRATTQNAIEMYRLQLPTPTVP